jgi:hypothetical protein
MEALWQYQLRIQFGDDFATLVRREPSNQALKPLNDVLAKFKATLTCQFDAFVDYVAEAEKHGIQRYPLYQWTKATIEDPAKQEKHLHFYTVYVSGDEVYPKEIADAIEADLSLLVDGVRIEGVVKHDTNPANNPQPPTREY